MVAQSQLDDPSTCDTKLVGTGPFTLVNWTQNESLELKKNPNYWQKDADGTQLPYLDELVYKPTPEGASRINGLLAGDLNAIQMSGGEQIDQLRSETEAGNINSYESDKFGEVSFGQLNTSVAPFNSKTARLAAIKSIDMEAYNATVNLDVLQNANGPFAPGGIGYLEDSGYPTYDLAESKKLVAQYKEETGTDLAFTLIATPDPATQAAAAVVQQMGKAAGIDVTITALEQAALISTAISGKYQAMVFRNYPGGDPDANYVWWKGAGNPVNFSRFDDAEINALLDEGRATPDKAKRQQIYGDINKRFATEGYSIWLQWTLWDIATATDVFGTLGPDLPDDAGAPFPGLASGHPVTGMWIQS
jgi:peptide/nickel transport system substrate-binding protein